MSAAAGAAIGGVTQLVGGLLAAKAKKEEERRRRVAEGEQQGFAAESQAAQNMGKSQQDAYNQMLAAYSRVLT